MILVDTSVWISVLRDKASGVVSAFRKKVGSDVVVLSRFNQHAAQERKLILSRTKIDNACYAAHTFSKITFDYEIR